MQKYAKGGVVQPFIQRTECEIGERIFPVPQINFNINQKKIKEVFQENGNLCFARFREDNPENSQVRK